VQKVVKGFKFCFQNFSKCTSSLCFTVLCQDNFISCIKLMEMCASASRHLTSYTLQLLSC